MNEDVALFWVQQALQTALYITAPMLGVALIVGLTVSIIQAITSVQEMTLSFIPKIAAAGMILLVMGSWMIQVLTDFFIVVFQYIPNVAG